MTRRRVSSLRTAILLSLAVGTAVAVGAAGVQEISPWVVAGGGGRSADGAGALAITGTIGQHAVGTSSAGDLAVRGGFWRGASPVASAVVDGAPDLPDAARLASIFPNPFNPTTKIAFELAESGPVRIRIHDARGQVVRELVHESYPAGRHEVAWNGRNDRGGAASSGVYFLRFETGDGNATRKMTLLK